MAQSESKCCYEIKSVLQGQGTQAFPTGVTAGRGVTWWKPPQTLLSSTSSRCFCSKFYKLKMLPLTLLVSRQQLAFPEPPRGHRASAPLWTPPTPALAPSVPSSLTSEHRLHDRHGQQDRSEQSVLMELRVCWESNISRNERLQPWIPYRRQWSLIEMMKTISSSLHTPCSGTHMCLTRTLLPPGRSPQAAAEEQAPSQHHSAEGSEAEQKREEC